MVFICLFQMTWSATMTKSIYIGHRSLNKLLLLQKYCQTYKLRYKILDVFSINRNDDDLITIIAFMTNLDIKDSESKLSFQITIWYAFYKCFSKTMILFFKSLAIKSKRLKISAVICLDFFDLTDDNHC